MAKKLRRKPITNLKEHAAYNKEFTDEEHAEHKRTGKYSRHNEPLTEEERALVKKLQAELKGKE